MVQKRQMRGKHVILNSAKTRGYPVLSVKQDFFHIMSNKFAGFLL